MRLVWGWTGSHYARFSQFVRSPAKAVRYLLDIARKREVRFIGHNPAGGLMIVGLLVALAVTALTVWMYTSDAFWGVEWVEDAHEASANLMLIMVLIHIGGVIVASVRHHENLVRAMVTGRKREAESGDVG